MFTIEEDLKNLLHLSQVDKKVFELQQTRRDLPQRIEALRQKIAAEEAAVQGLREEIARTEGLIRENQDAVAAETTSLEASEKRLANISTNREYDAVHLEIAAHKKNIDTALAQVLHFQQALENLGKDVEAAEASLAKVREEVDPELQTLTEELGGIEGRIAEESRKGEEPRTKISKKTLSFYDRMMQRRATPNIIAAVNHAHRSCDVCSRSQTSQRVIEVSKRRQLLTCETCGSLLVWRDEDVAALHTQDGSPDTPQSQS